MAESLPESLSGVGPEAGPQAGPEGGAAPGAGPGPAGISREPTSGEIFRDRLFRRSTLVLGIFVLALLGVILIDLGIVAWPAISEYGLDFLGDSTWDSNRNEFGILPQIFGTLYSSIIGLIIGGVLGVAVAIFISQGFLPRKLEIALKNIVELLAAIPSVVYGLWGIFFVIPVIRPFTESVAGAFPSFPLFANRTPGPNMLAASIVLAIMILPTVTAVSRDAIISVPKKLKEAAFGLGATRWECIIAVILPTASTGIFGALVLAFGRALGETMALAMLCGSNNSFNVSLFAPGNTLAGLIANTFPEASVGSMTISALMYAAIVLLLITLAVNVAGTLILMRANRNLRGLK